MKSLVPIDFVAAALVMAGIVFAYVKVVTIWFPKRSEYQSCLHEALDKYEVRMKLELAIRAGSNPPLHEIYSDRLGDHVKALRRTADSFGEGQLHETIIEMQVAAFPDQPNFISDMDACRRNLPRYREGG